MSRYLVTGALGAIGAWTVRSLLDRGDEVVGFDLGGSTHRLAMTLEPEELEALRLERGDITDLEAVERALDEHAIERVIHLAALQVPFVRADPPLGARVDVVGTVNVFEAVRRRGLAPLVYASSIAALGDGVPSTLYGVFKRANEGTAVRYFEDFGVASVGLRPHTVYGPGRDQGVTSAPSAAMQAAAEGRPFHIPFGGSLQLQYAPDVAEAFVRAGEAARDGAEVHNVDGPVASMAEVAAAIARELPDAEITTGEDPLPFPSGVDAASFVALLGGPVCRPLPEGVADALRRFRALSGT